MHTKTMRRRAKNKLTAFMMTVIFAGSMLVFARPVWAADPDNFVRQGVELVHEEDGSVAPESYYDADGHSFVTGMPNANTIIDIDGIIPEIEVTGDLESFYNDRFYVWAPVTDFSLGPRTINGTASLLFRNAAKLADGTAADFRVDLSNIHITYYSAPTVNKVEPEKEVFLAGWVFNDRDHLEVKGGGPDSGAKGYYAFVREKITLKVEKKGKEQTDSVFHFGMNDFDGPSLCVTSGYNVEYSSEKATLDGPMNEGVYSLSGLASDIYIPTSNWCLLSKNSVKTGRLSEAGGNYNDEASFDSGFATLAASGTSFEWRGQHCGSALLFTDDIVLMQHIVATTSGDHKDGGYITTDVLEEPLSTEDGGTYMSRISMAGGNSADYQIHVKDGYQLGALTVDGETVTPEEGDSGIYLWSFDKVYEDHTIDAQFTGPSVSYVWEGDHPDVDPPEGAEDLTPGEYTLDTTYKEGYTLEGEKDGEEGTWTFGGWDKPAAFELAEDTVITGSWTFAALSGGDAGGQDGGDTPGSGDTDTSGSGDTDTSGSGDTDTSGSGDTDMSGSDDGTDKNQGDTDTGKGSAAQGDNDTGTGSTDAVDTTDTGNRSSASAKNAKDQKTLTTPSVKSGNTTGTTGYGTSSSAGSSTPGKTGSRTGAAKTGDKGSLMTCLALALVSILTAAALIRGEKE